MRKTLSSPFANFILCVASMGLFFVVPKILAETVDPLVPMVVCGFGIFIFGYRMVHSSR